MILAIHLYMYRWLLVLGSQWQMIDNFKFINLFSNRWEPFMCFLLIFIFFNVIKIQWWPNEISKVKVQDDIAVTVIYTISSWYYLFSVSETFKPFWYQLPMKHSYQGILTRIELTLYAVKQKFKTRGGHCESNL